MTQILSHLNHPLIVVSDIHLQHLDDARGQLLLDLIGRIDPEKTEYFVLLGDIFDFCLGTHRYFRKKFKRLGIALSRLAGKGVKVVFFEGNHEFAIGGLGWPGIEFVVSPNRDIKLKSGAKIALCHGDLLAPDKKYLAFRGFVKSKPITWMSANFLPGILLDQYSLTHAKLSRMHQEKLALCNARVKKGVHSWAKDVEASFYIFGHFHVPYADPLGSGAQMASLESWDTPNVLLLTAHNELQRIYLQKVNDPFKIEPARPLL